MPAEAHGRIGFARGLADVGTSRQARWLEPVAAYVGAVVGAGFASGREVLHFFGRYGDYGLAGALLAGLVFALCGAAALGEAAALRPRHYGELLGALCGRSLGLALDRVAVLGLFLGEVAVVAGGGALAAHALGWAARLGTILFGGALAIAALPGRTGLRLGNFILVPLIVAAILVAAVVRLPFLMEHSLVASGRDGWAGAAFLYVSYNLLLGLSSLCVALPEGISRRSASWAGYVGGAALGVLCLGTTLAVLAHPEGSVAPLPLGVALEGRWWKFALYPTLLGAALWTTGSATAAALGQRLAPTRPGPMAAGICVAAVPLGLAGLVPIVAIAYPVLGYLGIPLAVGALGSLARQWWTGRGHSQG